MNTLTRALRVLLAALALVAGSVASEAHAAVGQGTAAASPGPATAAASGAEAAAPVQAVWVEHEQRFTYFGRTTLYTCSGLREKVRFLMRQVGARVDDLQVRVSCAEAVYSGLDPAPTVRIKAAVPARATPELLEEIAADSRRKLVARVQGKGADVDAATAQFPAQRRIVEFKGRPTRAIGAGDCELLEQMVREVFEPMGIRPAEGSRLGCVPNQVPLGSVDLRLETLQKVPEPGAAAAQR